MAKEFIVCSAVHYDNGVKNKTVLNVESGVIVCGRRHSDCYDIIEGLIGDIDMSKIPARDKQGFLTSKNRYVSRAEAFKIAKENNQITHKMFDNDETGSLNSEDLWWGDDKKNNK